MRQAQSYYRRLAPDAAFGGRMESIEIMRRNINTNENDEKPTNTGFSISGLMPTNFSYTKVENNTLLVNGCCGSTAEIIAQELRPAAMRS